MHLDEGALKCGKTGCHSDITQYVLNIPERCATEAMILHSRDRSFSSCVRMCLASTSKTAGSNYT